MGAVLAIAAKDLRQRFRDRSALVLGFVAPVAIATLMNAAFSGAEDFHATVVVADLDGSELSAGLVGALGSDELADVLTVEVVDGAAAARAAVDDGDAGAAIVVPVGFGDAVAGNRTADLEVSTSVDAELAGDVVHSIASGFAARLSATRLSVAAALAAGADPEGIDELVAAAVATPPPLAARDEPTGDRPLEGVAYYGPGMAMFFVLFAIGFTARGFCLERTQGTLDRIVAAPVSPHAVLLGKSLSVFVYAAASLATIALVAGSVLGASWGSPLGVAALCVAMAVSVVAMAAMVMALARTERQAETLASAFTFTLALLGGNFVFLSQAPEIMRRLAVLTPNGWALRGFTDLGTGVGAIEAVGQPIVGIAAFTAVVALLAAWFARRAVST